MRASNALRETVWPMVFAAATGYLFWYFPKFIISFGWAADALKLRFEPAGALDVLIAAVAIAAFAMGVATIRPAAQEGTSANLLDRASLFLGRVTMLLIVLLVLVMFYEVVLRYVFESPTLWANELSLWIASVIFLLSGLYAMQQRSHIRIYLLYDILPRWLQRLFDTLSTALILIFALAMIWGGYTEARDKLLRWETFGTAFDPPIPATLKPLLLLIILVVAVQALVNLIADWHKGPEIHSVVDEGEIEELVHDLGAQIPTDKG